MARSNRTGQATPLPAEFLDWQVALRARTMEADNGTPHVGVAPIVSVVAPGSPGWTSHSIICGLLPAAEQLERKTADFRALYEGAASLGAREVYDRGIEYLKDYYRRSEDFDPATITTLLPQDSPVVRALGASPSCSLLFFVFQLGQAPALDRNRCTQLDCVAELHREGPVYDNVWWHNTLFHGPADDHVVVRFRHQRSFDTGFGQLEALS